MVPKSTWAVDLKPEPKKLSLEFAKSFEMRKTGWSGCLSI